MHFSYSGRSFNEIAELRRFLHELPAGVTSLDLSQCSLSCIATSELIVLFLEEIPTVQFLNLSNNGFSREFQFVLNWFAKGLVIDFGSVEAELSSSEGIKNFPAIRRSLGGVRQQSSVLMDKKRVGFQPPIEFDVSEEAIKGIIKKHHVYRTLPLSAVAEALFKKEENMVS